MTNAEYKEMLINEILKWQTRGQYTREQLRKKSIRVLEKIYDIID